MEFRYLKSNQLFAESAYEKLFETCARPLLVADHLRNADNMGALIRLADNTGAAELLFLGDEESVNASKLQRAAASSYRNIPWMFCEDEAFFKKIPEFYKIVALETTVNSTNLYQTQLPEKSVFVVGNEVRGIRESVLLKADFCVHIPVPGPTRSLNVSHAASVVLFEWLRQMMHRYELI
jgi:tRNA G18 (ribose-2'-O)-methylase SpoU